MCALDSLDVAHVYVGIFCRHKSSLFTSCPICPHPVHFFGYSSKQPCVSFLVPFSTPTQAMKLKHYYGPLVDLRKADYTEGDRMVEMWAWLSPAWIMMWTLIQRNGQRDWGLRDFVGSGLWPGGFTTGSHGLCIYNASHVLDSVYCYPSLRHQHPFVYETYSGCLEHIDWNMAIIASSNYFFIID